MGVAFQIRSAAETRVRPEVILAVNVSGHHGRMHVRLVFAGYREQLVQRYVGDALLSTGIHVVLQ